MAPFYVGQQTQFAHAERNAAGGLLPPTVGRWSVSNPAVASINQSGLATWLAEGETQIVFAVVEMRRAGFFPAVVLAAPVASLEASPASFEAFQNSVVPVTISAFDADDDPIEGFVIDDIVSSDESLARIIKVSDTQFIVLTGSAAGDVTITVTSGDAELELEAVIGTAQYLDATAGDARYRRLGVTIPDSQVTKTEPLVLPDVSGAQDLHWSLAARAQAYTLVGDTVSTVHGLARGEFAFYDVFQGAGGGWSHEFLSGAGMPPIQWVDGNVVPVQSLHGRDSYLLFNERDERIIAARTYENVQT